MSAYYNENDGAVVSDFAVGDRVFYILPKGNGRPAAVYLPATVIRFTFTAITVKLDGHRRLRSVRAFGLTKRQPVAPPAPPEEA